MPQPRRHFRIVIAFALIAPMTLAAAGCTAPTPGLSSNAASSAVPVSSSVSIASVAGDKVLTIAAQLPGTGAHSAAASATEAGVQLAVREIRASGLGPTVSLSLSDANGASTLPASVDAIVNPFPAKKTASPSGTVFATLNSADGAIPTDDFVARLKSVSPRIHDAEFAAESYDAVTAIAIAEVIAGSDSAAAIDSALPLLAAGGYSCVSYGDCATAVKAGQSITLHGQGGTAVVVDGVVSIGALTLSSR